MRVGVDRCVIVVVLIIEFLVVIAIIAILLAILLAILFPVFAQAKHPSRQCVEAIPMNVR